MQQQQKDQARNLPARPSSQYCNSNIYQKNPQLSQAILNLNKVYEHKAPAEVQRYDVAFKCHPIGGRFATITTQYYFQQFLLLICFNFFFYIQKWHLNPVFWNSQPDWLDHSSHCIQVCSDTESPLVQAKHLSNISTHSCGQVTYRMIVFENMLSTLYKQPKMAF